MPKTKSVSRRGNDVQIIKDAKSGLPVFAVMPWSNYERLISGDKETAMLIAAGNAARSDERFPEAVARRLVAGESPLKVFREEKGLSQAALAAKSGVAGQYISQIERNTRNAGRSVAKRLGDALGVSPEVLMDI
jgi:DNA-binding XRE family transcriptional regulator